VVRVSLPIHEVARPTRRQRAEESKFAGRQALVVEGSAVHRRILEQLLADWHVHAVSADAEEPYWDQIERAVAGDEPCDVLLVDTSLRDAEGVSLVDRVVAAGWQIPLVQLLPVGEPRRLECAAQPAVFLEKPLSHRKVWNALEEAWNPTGVARSVPKSARPATVRPLHVLLAEDTVANQKIVKRILGKRGHTVAIARNGREVVEMVRGHAFDIILMDVQMPVMDGLQAAQAIRFLEATMGERIPIVALTAHAMPGDRERCLAAGMDAYLSKPVDTAELIEVLESLVTANGSRRSPAPRTTASETVDRQCFDLQASLYRLGGDRALLGSLIGFFLEDAPGLVSQLRAAVEQGEPHAIEHAAHSLKGLVANFDAHDAVRAAARLEKAGHDGDLATARDGLPVVAREVERLQAALQRHIDDDGAPDRAQLTGG
jgi:CheY-like chemotaxis protein/HPt (histidine-containing phosphotransfer) domain-containing protein